LRAASADFRERYNFGNIIGQSAEIRDVLGRIVRIAPTDATVLITGESGTGKELVARAIHANSLRGERPFVSINCAALTETLLESELFGHMRGAFTGAVQTRKGLFEEANGGTFFFDEIAETPPSLQAKLLRAIQEGEIRRLGDNSSINVDARIIAATNQDLRVLIEEKRFREDLYYRLNVARFELPPLRERKEDIAPIVDSFLEKYGKKMARQATLGPGVMDYLVGYDFPGNIRELENLIEQGVALAQGGQIHLSDIVPNGNSSGNSLHAGRHSLADIVQEVERDAIVRALRQVEGHKERAAELLGLSPTTLWRKMKRLRLEWP
jgi:two-component system response regulator HydG